MYSASLLLPMMAALWITAGPGSVTPSTVMIVAILGISTAGVVALSVKNAQATGSIGQLIYETDAGAAAAERTPQRGIEASTRGRVALAVSVVMTMTLLAFNVS